MSQPKVDIQGAVSKQELAKTAEKAADLQQTATEMSLPKPLPVDVGVPSRDIKEKESVEEKIEETKKVLEEDSLSAVSQAEPEKAKKRQTRKRKNVEPQPPAGNFTPDYLKIMEDRFSKLEEMHKATHDLYKGLETVLASQTPLQANGVIPANKKIRYEMPARTNDMVDFDASDHVDNIPLHNRPRSPPPARRTYSEPVVNQRDVDLYRRRNKEALDAMIYDTDETMRNRNNNTTAPRSSDHWYSRW